ncbi:MAG: isoprenylcysteine carboxylmethyltransferase family protein [Rhizomicrobium sp.]
MSATIPHFLFEQRPLWALIFSVSYAAWIGFEFWVFSRDRRAARGERADRGSRSAIFVFITLGITLAFVGPNLVPLARIALPPAPVFYVAIGLFWAGIVLRLWAILTLGRFFRTAVLVLEEHRLVTTGPYRLLRHPAYSGGLLTIAGLGLAMGNWVSALGAPLCVLIAYAWRIYVEEKALRARFGAAFEEHRRRTWAVMPFVW